MNRWTYRKCDGGFWQCFRWDVIPWYGGMWIICTPYGRTFKAGFKSAAAAKRWADWYDQTPDMLN